MTTNEALKRSVGLDAAGLALLTIVTALPYVTRLGFYSDDWYILWRFHADALRHISAISTVVDEFADRPLQGLYLVAQYMLFGFQPLGYHLMNTAVIAVAVALFFWLLVRLTIDRASAFGAGAVLVVLPQLSTVRAWYEASQIPLSLVAALVSIHCQLSFARTGRYRWAASAAVAAVLSVAAYEIFAPLIAAFAIGLLALEWRAQGRPAGRQAAAFLALIILIGLLALAKYWISPRPQPPDLHRYWRGLIQLFRPDYDWRTDYALNIFAALSVHFWWPLVGLWRGAKSLADGGLDWLSAAAALAAAALTFWRMRSAAEAAPGRPWTSARLLLLGLTVFVLGHAVFLIVPAMSFSPTGMANRALVAAALGVALILIAALRWAAALAPGRMQPTVFASAVATAILLGSLRIEQIESYWSEASAIQAKVLAAVSTDLKDVPPQSFVMLDGVCPYHGPAVLFEAPWDVSGALSLASGRTIRGDAVSARMSLRPNGLTTSIYGERAFYAFGPNLYVYDPRRHEVAQLTDIAAARRYFRESGSRTPCPRGYPGQGVLI